MITRHRRLATLAATIGLVALFLPVFAGIAFGHHAITAALVDCNGTVSWTVTNWTNNNAAWPGDQHPHHGVVLDEPAPDGPFTVDCRAAHDHGRERRDPDDRDLHTPARTPT